MPSLPMRRLIVFVLLAVVVRAGDAAQNAQRPTEVFRGKVDLITIDVAAVDAKGRPVEDLKRGDFVQRDALRVRGLPHPVTPSQRVAAGRSICEHLDVMTEQCRSLRDVVEDLKSTASELETLLEAEASSTQT